MGAISLVVRMRINPFFLTGSDNDRNFQKVLYVNDTADFNLTT